MTVIGYKLVSCVDTSHESYTGPQRDVGPVLASPYVNHADKTHSGAYSPLVYAAHREVVAQNYCPDKTCKACGGIYFYDATVLNSNVGYLTAAAIEVLDADGVIKIGHSTGGRMYRSRSVALGHVVPLLSYETDATSGYLCSPPPPISGLFLIHYAHAVAIATRRATASGVYGGAIERQFPPVAYEWRLTEDGEMLFATPDEAAAEYVASWRGKLKPVTTQPPKRGKGKEREADREKLAAWVNGEGIRS